MKTSPTERLVWAIDALDSKPTRDSLFFRRRIMEAVERISLWSSLKGFAWGIVVYAIASIIWNELG